MIIFVLLMSSRTGASKIFIFDHTVRRQAIESLNGNAEAETLPPTQDAPRNLITVFTTLGPVQSVHIDQSYASAPDRVTFYLPDEAEKLLRGHFEIINVWRPIKTNRKDPLGLIRAGSFLDEELVPIKIIYPHRTGETVSVRPAKEGRTDGGHQWFYLFEQRPDEVMLIECFDSKTDGRVRMTPHSAFVDEEFVGEEARESIEVRALVLHSDDTQ
jgi:hypothetical protein